MKLDIFGIPELTRTTWKQKRPITLPTRADLQVYIQKYTKEDNRPQKCLQNA